jgi:hypothetical protein
MIMGKHATYRGISSDHYRMMRDSMDAEAFGKWVQTVTGKPRNTRKRDPLIKAYEESKPIDWESLARKLQRALIEQINECKHLERMIESHQQTIFDMENRSWFSRLFNLKG